MFLLHWIIALLATGRYCLFQWFSNFFMSRTPKLIPGFPTHQFICSSPPWLKHRPPHFEFLFLELDCLLGVVGIYIPFSYSCCTLGVQSVRWAQMEHQNIRHNQSETIHCAESKGSDTPNWLQRTSELVKADCCVASPYLCQSWAWIHHKDYSQWPTSMCVLCPCERK